MKYKIEDIKLSLNKKPHIDTRPVYFDDTEEEIEDKQEKMFLNGKTVILTVYLPDIQFTITAKKGYEFDGATIPFNLGKGDMRLQIPSLFHDIMCENKELVFRNRNLSTLIFKKLLLECGISKLRAEEMYLAVDNFQRTCDGWDKE